MRPEVQISDQLAQDAAQLLADAAATGGHIVLTGGSTPKAAYGLAAGMSIDWSGTELWFGDERCVPPDHEHSNYKMGQENLLDHISPKAVHRMRGGLGPAPGATRH